MKISLKAGWYRPKVCIWTEKVDIVIEGDKKLVEEILDGIKKHGTAKSNDSEVWTVE